MSRKTSSLMALVAGTMLVMAACTNKSSEENNKSVKASQQPEAASMSEVSPAATASVSYVPGTAVHTSDVVSITKYAEDGTAITDDALASMLTTFTVLGSRVGELALVDRGVETADHRIELYSKTDLILVLGMNEDKAEVVWARSDFAADQILFVTNTSDQGEVTSAYKFDFKSCLPAEVIAPDKDQDQQQDQQQDQKQSQDKQPVKAPVVAEPICQSMTVLVAMKQQMPPKVDTKQDQSKDDSKKGTQDQTKN